MHYRIAATALAALLLTAGVQAEIPSQGFQLIYDPETGSLTIDTGGNDLVNYTISIASDAPEDFPTFNTANYMPLPGGTTLPTSDTQLAELNLTGWTNLPPTSIGNVLPTNLTQAQLQQGIVAVFNNTSSGFSDDLVVTGGVPEPSTIALLAAGGLLIARRRRDA